MGSFRVVEDDHDNPMTDDELAELHIGRSIDEVLARLRPAQSAPTAA